MPMLFDKIAILLAFVVIGLAQTNINLWNGVYYNTSVIGPPGWLVNLDTATLFTDWFDNAFNVSTPFTINATYHAQSLIFPTLVSFNVTLNGFITLNSGTFISSTTQTLSLTTMPVFTSPCQQLSGTSSLNLCPYYALTHFFTNGIPWMCDNTLLPRCNQLSIRWPFLANGPSVAVAVGVPYSMIRGNAQCIGASTDQGQAGNVDSYKQISAQILFGIKITANATGNPIRVCWDTRYFIGTYDFYLYADNIGTPVGGQLLHAAPFVFSQTAGFGLAGTQQATGNYVCRPNLFFQSLSITSGSVYWLLAASGGQINVPWVSAGCAALSSFISTSAIVANAPPLVGPAGTVGSDCFFMFITTC